jgi:hypothetical protein
MMEDGFSLTHTALLLSSPLLYSCANLGIHPIAAAFGMGATLERQRGDNDSCNKVERRRRKRKREESCCC